MFKQSILKTIAAALFALTAVLGVAGSAQAAIVGAKFDPLYGDPFTGPDGALGWKGSAAWFLPDNCLSLSGTVANTDGCSGGGMSMLSATVDFYSASNPSTTLAELTWGAGAASVTNMTLASGGPIADKVIGVTTGLTGGLTPNSTFDHIGLYSFGLKFTGTNVQLFYALNSQPAASVNTFSTQSFNDDVCEHNDQCKPCALGNVDPTHGCGVNSDTNPPALTFTTAVPEPQTYALMLAGLAVIGFVARRRRRS